MAQPSPPRSPLGAIGSSEGCSFLGLGRWSCWQRSGASVKIQGPLAYEDVALSPCLGPGLGRTGRRRRDGRAHESAPVVRPRPGGHRLGFDPDAQESDQPRLRPAGPDLGGRRGQLSRSLQPPTRGRSDRHPGGFGWGRRSRQAERVRAGARPARPDGRGGDRQQGGRIDGARRDRLHRRQWRPEVRSRGGQARGPPDRIPRQEPRPHHPQRDRGSGRPVVLERGQLRGDVHRPFGQDLPHR